MRSRLTWTTLIFLLNSPYSGASIPEFSIKTTVAPVRGEIQTAGFQLVSVMPKLICRFESPKGSPQEDQAMPEAPVRAFIRPRANLPHRYRLELSEANLTAQTLPGMLLKSCSYQLEILGRVTEDPGNPRLRKEKDPRLGESVQGRIELLGSALKDLSGPELDDWLFNPRLDERIANRIRPLKLSLRAKTLEIIRD